MSRIAIAGAGIAGLTVGVRLMDAHEVTVFEREPAPGGKIHSQAVDGCVFEWGPNGVLAGAPEVRELVRLAGLDEDWTQAAPAVAKRFIYWGGRLHELSPKPPRLLATSLLSPAGKLRALGDVFARPRRAPADESVGAFARRHFGREVAERIVAPALLGISGGDAETTSAAALFPRLVALERAHGSVIRGMLRARGAPGRLHSFAAGGMQRLTDALAQRLGTRLRRGAAVERIEPRDGAWRVHAGGGIFEADAVVLAIPAGAAAAAVAGFDSGLASRLREIPYAPMRVVGIAYRRADVADPLDGFGFLAARGSGVRSLGCLYTSSLFPAHAPPDTVYLRVFLGGAGDPGVASLSAGEAAAIVRADLARVLDLRAEPVAVHDVAWPQAIPQYALGHPERVGAIDARAALHPGLALAGNAYRGLGVSDTVRDAFAVAAALRS